MISTRLPLDLEQKAEVDADAYYTAIEALEIAEAEARTNHEITRSEIARILGMDKASVTKILNGSKRNITLKTLFMIMKAMNRKVVISSYDLYHKIDSDNCFAIPAISMSKDRLITYSNLANKTVSDLTFIKNENTSTAQTGSNINTKGDFDYKINSTKGATFDV